MDYFEPEDWLRDTLSEAWDIETPEYRCVETYGILLAMDYELGDKCHFTRKQLASVNLPPIPEDEAYDIITILVEYKRRVENYWTY